jgi:hypothetical protein
MPEKRWGNPYLVGKHGDAAAVWPRRPRITVDANDPRRLTGGRSGYSLVTREMVWSLKPGARESCSRTGTFMAVILRLLQRRRHRRELKCAHNQPLTVRQGNVQYRVVAGDLGLGDAHRHGAGHRRLVAMVVDGEAAVLEAGGLGGGEGAHLDSIHISQQRSLRHRVPSRPACVHRQAARLADALEAVAGIFSLGPGWAQGNET